MRHLLYCLFHYDPSLAAFETGGSGVFVLHRGDLAVAASYWTEEPGKPGVAALLSYERSVAGFHACRTIIPLRFGCIAEDRAQVLEILEQNLALYEQLLHQLDGCTEIGLRFWLEPAAGEPAGEPPATPGIRYLAEVRRRQTGLAPSEDRLAERICAPLAGQFVQKNRSARPALDGRLVSLHFLVARERVENFKEQVKQTCARETARFLVSGPWPPYHFVEHVQH